jgi:hypothetical protein
MSATQEIDVEYLQGIHVMDSVLWLDALRRADLCFLSHAHVHPVDPHRKVLATRETIELMRHRMERSRVLVTPFGRPFTLGDLDLELHPSGHMLGAAQLSARRGNHRLVYTGDFSLAPSRTSGQAQVLPCDVLVLVANYGQSWHVLPDRSEVESKIVGWARAALEEDRRPVLLVPPLGKAQELALVFKAQGLQVRAHENIYRACRKHEELGLGPLDVRLYRGSVRSDEVLLLPPGARHARTLQRLAPVSTAAATGRALEKDAARAIGVERAFPYSMQADHPALLRYVSGSGADRIYVVGRTASAFAGSLRTNGVNAWPLLPPEQMELFRRQHAAN